MNKFTRMNPQVLSENRFAFSTLDTRLVGYCEIVVKGWYSHLLFDNVFLRKVNIHNIGYVSLMEHCAS